MTLTRKALPGFILGILLLAPSLQAEEQLFATVGAGQASSLIFRTVFRVSNESAQDQTFRFEFLQSNGEPAEPSLRAVWSQPGQLEKNEGGWDLTLPAAASVELALNAGEPAWFGWARVNTDSGIPVTSRLQLARGELEGPDTFLFEDLIFRETELLATRGSRKFSFPVTFIDSTRDYDTAFALVNLADRPTSVELTLRPDQVKTVQLEPGQVFRSYFREFFDLAVPAIFPLRLEAVTQVRSDAPVAMTVLRTLDGLPLSGVSVTAMPEQSEVRQAVLGEEIELKLGDTVRLGGTDLELTFWNVSEDSRCPLGAVCIWEGRAVIDFRSRFQGEENQFQLVYQAGLVEASTRILGPYAVQLKSVIPIPDISQPPIQASDYRIRLLVRLAED